jgi:hypothetical protein
MDTDGMIPAFQSGRHSHCGEAVPLGDAEAQRMTAIYVTKLRHRQARTRTMGRGRRRAGRGGAGGLGGAMSGGAHDGRDSPRPDGLAIRWPHYFRSSDGVCRWCVCARSGRYRRSRPEISRSRGSPRAGPGQPGRARRGAPRARRGGVQAASVDLGEHPAQTQCGDEVRALSRLSLAGLFRLTAGRRCDKLGPEIVEASSVRKLPEPPSIRGPLTDVTPSAGWG